VTRRIFGRRSIVLGGVLLCLTSTILQSDGQERGAPTASSRATQRQQFLTMFARSYFPGRSGQIMLVPAEADFITRPEAAYQFMHGSPWDYDTRIPMLFYGSPYIRAGAYADVAAPRDVAPTIAALIGARMPATANGRSLASALNSGAGAPRVVLIAVVDAMRADYFDRYSAVMPVLTGLKQKGAWFRDARVNYLPTVTSAAHSTISTGADPRIHGIVVNNMFDRAKGQTGDPFPGVSPQNLMALTLTDVWSQATGGRAVMIAQGGLAYTTGGLAGHGACILNGRPLIAAAYSRTTGVWETNPECYRLPEYLKGSNARALWESMGGKWNGHDISSPEAVRHSAPFSRFEGEALTALITHEPLGADEIADLVLVNLKATDFVGHAFGPDSPEMRETLSELDRQFGKVVEALDRKVGTGRYVIVVTADHGMPPEPRPDSANAGSPASARRRRVPADVIALLNQKFDPQGKPFISNYDAANSQMFIDRDRLRELGFTLTDIATFLETQPFIFAAYTEDEVRSVDLGADRN
jgi:hypothetical protein